MDPRYAVTSVVRRLLYVYVTGKRNVCFFVTTIVSDHDDINSHTHTFIIGSDWILLERTGHVCTMYT